MKIGTETTIVNAVLSLAVIGGCIALCVVLLTGCASTGPSATDWRSIHQPSPNTGS